MLKVMAFGTFDIMHPGHSYFLREAKKLGDYLVVVIARDTTVIAVKKQKPIHSETERLLQVKQLDIADEVVLGNEGDKYQIIRDQQPSILALGYDQTFFTDTLPEEIKKQITAIRLPSYHPEKYKSSKLRPSY